MSTLSTSVTECLRGAKNLGLYTPGHGLVEALSTKRDHCATCALDHVHWPTYALKHDHLSLKHSNLAGLTAQAWQ